jgi:hypothetical protein
MTPDDLLDRMAGWRLRLEIGGWWTKLDQEFYEAVVAAVESSEPRRRTEADVTAVPNVGSGGGATAPTLTPDG